MLLTVCRIRWQFRCGRFRLKSNSTYCGHSRSGDAHAEDRKSTRLNSSHPSISYAVNRPLHSFPTRRSSDLSLTSLGFRSQNLTAPYIAGYAALAGNWVYVAYGLPHSVAIPLWSVSIEEQFYLLWPLAIRRCSRRRSEEHTSELQSPVHLVCRQPASTLFPYTTLFRSFADVFGFSIPKPDSPLYRGLRRARRQLGLCCLRSAAFGGNSAVVGFD